MDQRGGIPRVDRRNPVKFQRLKTELSVKEGGLLQTLELPKIKKPNSRFTELTGISAKPAISVSTNFGIAIARKNT